MKKSFFVLLVLAILSTPLWILGMISILRVPPQAHQPIVEPIVDVTPIVQPISAPIVSLPSASFMSGYWDGWHGKWLGPIRWTLNDEYRQGHMLGTYDREKGIDRYSPAP